MELSDVTVYAKGGFARYEDAKVGLLTHGLQYGTGCFEGIRGYWVPEESELFLVLLRDHYERLGGHTSTPRSEARLLRRLGRSSLTLLHSRIIMS